MAEFDNEAVSLDLFQEIFNSRTSRDGAVDLVSKTVNNCVDSNVNKHSSENFLKSAIENNIDNGAVTQIDDADDIIEENSSIDSDVIRLNNIENLKKQNETNNTTTVTSDDNKTDIADHDSDNVDDQTNAFNGNANTGNNSDDKTCGKQKKGISFPMDTFISGYFEPPDPWKNAPSWTSDELVSAYKKSCDQHGTKPIAKLLQQLQTCSAGKQEELLSLKGEKLDQKQCECLEEVLRRVQFKLVDLEASHLDDECAVALFDMIEYYESACQLNIAFNRNIQARGWQACSRLVRRTPNLTYLDLRNCDLNDRNIPIFGRALKLGCHLTILHMESMNLSGRPLVILVAALKMNETLQELFLAENKLMPTDGVQLGNLLRYNHKLSLLDLRNNHLQDVGTSHISDGLMEQDKGTGLRTLVLWNNTINYQAMPALGRALAVNESLETLNIGHNSLTNEGVHLLKDGLLKTNSLLRLGLQGTKITDEGAVALAEYIADSIILLRIDLRDNEIKTGGLMALSHAMRVNTSVTRIDLDKEPKKESSMKDYAEQQSHLLRDIYTFQQRNIQATVKKEEEQKIAAELVEAEKVEAVPADVQEDMQDEQDSSTVLANTCAQSFTLLENEKDEVVVKDDVEHEKDKKDAENVKAKNIGEMLRESQSQYVESDPEELDNNLSKDDVKSRQRPSVLFPYLGLPPQASLDSPLPTSNVSPLISVLSEPASLSQPPAQPLPSSQKGHLTLNVGCAPGEMILSPQYFPKQIARKIFSVSRVDEDPSWPPLSTSPTPHNPFSAAFDPLNVSPIPLVPISSSALPLSSSPLLVPQCTLRVPQHSKAALQVSVSPGSSLFQDLSEETVRHMVSPVNDIDVKSMLAQNLEPKKITDSSDNLSVESNSGPVFSKSSDNSAELSNIFQQDKILTTSNNVIDNCDNLQSLGVENGSSLVASAIFKEDLCETNSGADNLVVITSQIENKQVADFASEILQQNTFLIPENTIDTAYVDNSLKTSDLSPDIDDHTCSSDNSYKNDFPVQAKGDGIVNEVLKMNILKTETGSECDNDTSDNPFFSIKGSIENTANHSEMGSHITKCGDKGTGNDESHCKSIPENEELFDQHDHAADILSENSFESLCDRHSPSTLIDINTVNKQVSFSLNSNKPSLLLSVDNNEQSSVIQNANTEISQTEFLVSTVNEEHSSSSIPDLNEATGHEDMQENASGSLEKSGCADNCADVYNSSSDNIENVHFSLDEESWLAVGAESDGGAVRKSKESLTQPDFFTTLSVNGLTQELANALTSVDVSTTSYGSVVDNLDLRPHDEFEKELDALLAIVQSELPWPLKDS